MHNRKAMPGKIGKVRKRLNTFTNSAKSVESVVNGKKTMVNFESFFSKQSQFAKKSSQCKPNFYKGL